MQNGYVFGGGGAVMKLVQRGTVSYANVTSATATISAVVVANTKIRGGGVRGSTSGRDGTKCMFRQELTNTTTITFYSIAADAGVTYTLPYEASEFYGGAFKSMQSGTIAYTSGTPATATISSVDTTKTELDYLGATNATNLGSNMVDNMAIVLTNATTITANDGYATGTNQTVGYQAAESY